MTDSTTRALAISADSPEPLWIQAANLILAEIASGALRPGMRLPPERELCVQLDISRVTLRKALTKLVDDGVLNASHGRGWYVANGVVAKEWPNSLESFTETANRMGLVSTSSVLRSAVTPASFDEAELLSIAPGTPLFHIDRVRLLNDVPIAIDRSSLPASRVAGFETIDFTAASLFDELERAGISPARADSTIEAREADASVASSLGIEPGKPVLVLRQLVFGDDDQPLMTSTIEYSGDRYRLRTYFARSRPASHPAFRDAD